MYVCVRPIKYSYIDILIDNCRKIKSLFSKCLVEHVKQTSNVAIHHLTKLVFSSVDTIWIEDCPHYIVSYVATDMVA